MSCPSCGGTRREAIAPGYWRCTSQVTLMAPGPGPYGKPGPPEIAVARECGAAYQEGARVATGQMCECSTFAVGVCGDCGTPVCGTHSLMRGDIRVCRTCAARRDHERTVAEQRVQERKLQVFEREEEAKRAVEEATEIRCRDVISALRAAGSPGVVRVAPWPRKRLQRATHVAWALYKQTEHHTYPHNDGWSTRPDTVFTYYVGVTPDEEIFKLSPSRKGAGLRPQPGELVNGTQVTGGYLRTEQTLAALSDIARAHGVFR